MCCSKEIATFIADSTPLVIVRLIDLIDRPTPPGPVFGSGGGDHGEESQVRYLRDSLIVSKMYRLQFYLTDFYGDTLDTFV